MKNDLRVIVTKRMLREGLLQCLKSKPLSKITVTELCREAGVNRATFYHHYETPPMILREMAYEYYEHMGAIYKAHQNKKTKTNPLEAIFNYVLEHKDELKVMLSNNAENYLASIFMDITNEFVSKHLSSYEDSVNDREEYLLRAVMAASATFSFIQVWITMDIDKSTKELAEIVRNGVRDGLVEL